jgi:hypothetical protein
MGSFYHHPPMRSSALAAATVLATTAWLAAAGAASAAAATIKVDRPCYADPSDRTDTVQLSGTGFTPGASYQVTLDGQPLAGGSGQIDAAGNMAGRFVAPSVTTASRLAHQHTFRLGVREGDNAPETPMTVSRLYASFKPTTGALATLSVRFSLYGFGLLGARRPPVYVHYVGPSGRVARSVRLGTATQACGFLRTPKRRLFAFSDPRPGAWRLQFDTRKSYTRGRPTSRFLFYTVPVTVR